MKGGIKQSIRNHVASLVFGLAPVKSTMANILSEVAVGYPTSPLNAKSAHVHGGPQPGQRAPIRKGEPAVGSWKHTALCVVRRRHAYVEIAAFKISEFC